MRPVASRPAAALACAAAGAALPFATAVVAWPEIVGCAYFAARGSLLYRDIYFPHTPLLILLTAAGGWLFGFSAQLFRCLIGLSLASSAALLALGLRPHRARPSWLAPLLVTAPALLCLTGYAGGPELWPDAFMAPLVLGAGLLLERFERGGRRRDLVSAGVCLGLAILVKQTSAWITIAAALWGLARSRRAGARTAAGIFASASAPYLLFVALWGLGFQTLSHLRWTLLVPLQMGGSGEISAPFTLDVAREAVAPFLALPAFLLAGLALAPARRLRSPVPWLLAGVLGMAYPRGDLSHLAAGLGLLALLLGRSFVLLSAFLRRHRRRSARPGRLALFTFGGAAALISLTVAVLGGGDLLVGQLGGPARYWDDTHTRRYEALARRRLRPGDELVVFQVPNESLYARTGTAMPGGMYVNTSFWYCLDKEGAEERLIEALRRRPGTLVLFRDTETPELRRTGLYRFLTTSTDVLEKDGDVEWRAVRPTSPTPR